MAGTQSYIDYDSLLSRDFNPSSYANKLVHQTNNANDPSIDLATPLSRVLFDAQEIDTHIDSLTTQHALPLIEHTRVRAEASQHVLEEVETQVSALSNSYDRLAREVGQRYEAAAQVHMAAERLVRTVRLGRAVQRSLALGRQLQTQSEELLGVGGHRSMISAAHSVLGLRQLLAASGKDEEGEGLGRVLVVTTLRNEIIAPAERLVLNRAQQVVREFSMSSLVAAGGGNTTYKETEDTKSKATCALQTLYLLSPHKPGITLDKFEPSLLLQSLQSYLQTALTSSLASLSRALATLPSLDRTLLEISARCQNIVALEALLETTKPTQHPDIGGSGDENFLIPLLRHLDTSSLPSYFWRSMAGQMSNRVQEILVRGGVSARTLRSNRDRVRDAVRECVGRGSQLPVSSSVLGRKDGNVGNWEREAAVMVGSIMAPLQR